MEFYPEFYPVDAMANRAYSICSYSEPVFLVEVFAKDG
jgi:hypothetical protein